MKVSLAVTVAYVLVTTYFLPNFMLFTDKRVHC